MQTQRKTFRLGGHRAKQGPHPLSNNQGRVENSVTGPTMMKKTTHSEEKLRNVSRRLSDKRAEKDSAGIVDSKENK